jgi:hypothetical protein
LAVVADAELDAWEWGWGGEALTLVLMMLAVGGTAAGNEEGGVMQEDGW